MVVPNRFSLCHPWKTSKILTATAVVYALTHAFLLVVVIFSDPLVAVDAFSLSPASADSAASSIRRWQQQQQQWKHCHRHPSKLLRTSPLGIPLRESNRRDEVEGDDVDDIFVRVPSKRGRRRLWSPRDRDDDDFEASGNSSNDNRWTRPRREERSSSSASVLDDDDQEDEYYNEAFDQDEEEEEDDHDYDDDEDWTFDPNDIDTKALLENMVIPNPLLDSIDPDGAADRFPELASDPKFWIDMALFVAFLNFLSFAGPRDPFPDLPWY